MIIPELLAPVGSKEALTAAIQNGADAVYLGGKSFSARQYANNFEQEDLREAFYYAHVRGVKVYVTVNTLLNDRELPEAAEYLKFLYENGVDAVIIQDLGVARLAAGLLPDLPLHASTQMTVHNSAAVEVLKSHHFQRVVLARELSLSEISEIKKKTGAELEVFVHGALCVSYSGQCLMSSMIGGRSGNRGRCAQPCRMEYTLVDQQGKALTDPKETGSHLLSPKDLNMLEHLPDLARAGVGSLKIEGRMKRPEYVATVIRIYRAALDRLKASPEHYKVDKQELKELGQIFNRGFTTGYFYGRQGKDMMSFKRPNNRGIRLGRVTRASWAEKSVEILLEDALNLGDGIEFWVTEGGRKGIVIHKMTVDGKPVEKAFPGQKIQISAEGKINTGDRVFKTSDAELLSAAEQSYKSSKEIKKIPLQFSVTAKIGQPFSVTVSDDLEHVFKAESEYICQEAIKKPLTLDVLEEQLGRLGNTPFAIGGLYTDRDENVMVPSSEMNEARRKAIEGISQLRTHINRTAQKDDDFSAKTHRLLFNQGVHGQDVRVHERAFQGEGNLQLSVKAPNLNLLRIAAEKGADLIYFGEGKDLQKGLEICQAQHCQMIVSTPRISREKEMASIDRLLDFAASNHLPVLAGNIGILKKARDMGVEQIYTDFSFNVFNSQAIHWLGEQGIKGVTLSPELTLEQIKALRGSTNVPLEAIVEGHLPLMVTEYCPQGSILGGEADQIKCTRTCKTGSTVGLKDRLGLVFPITHDSYCRTHIYNAKALSMIEDVEALYQAGISVYRIELSIEAPDRAALVVGAWRKEINSFKNNRKNYSPDAGVKDAIAAMTPAGLTKGHYYRGVE